MASVRLSANLLKLSRFDLALSGFTTVMFCSCTNGAPISQPVSVFTIIALPLGEVKPPPATSPFALFPASATIATEPSPAYRVPASGGAGRHLNTCVHLRPFPAPNPLPPPPSTSRPIAVPWRCALAAHPRSLSGTCRGTQNYQTNSAPASATIDTPWPPPPPPSASSPTTR